MIDPLRLAFEVDCPVDAAFELWTVRTDTWWPPGHTKSGEPGARVMFEPRVGGRVFERTPSGQEIQWGEVTAWDPPHRLAYLWHLMQDRSEATDVEVTFTADEERTHVAIEHGGWDRLGADGPTRRERNLAGWGGVLPHYTIACGEAIPKT